MTLNYWLYLLIDDDLDNHHRSLMHHLFFSPGHAFRGAGHRHRRHDGQVDSTNGLPRRYHQQEPIGAAPDSLHHCQPGALPVWTGSQEQQQASFKTRI